MKSHAQVVVIGGGVVGCSVLYHLALLGCTDVVLCERKELTAGSSWHAAGGFHALNGDQGMSRLQAYTVRLYRDLEKESDQDIGLHFTGGLNVAATRARWDVLRADQARHRVLGLDTHLVGPEEIGRLCPLIDTRGLFGAVFDPMEGHLDPSGATHAYARAARARGATIHRQTRVLGLEPSRQGWRVITNQGEILAEHVVNAAGLWAREVGHMAGVELPLIPMEHHYLLTEDLPELLTQQQEMPLMLDLDGEIYLRQERKGVLLGVYEKQATAWAVNGTSWDYGETELLPPNMDRLVESLNKGFARFPSVANAGIRRIINGPFTFTPDGNPLVGPVPGLRNYWSACGVMAGFAQGGGVGLTLAQWITRGEPDGDVFALDVARFGQFATRRYTLEKAAEFYSRRFQMAFPNEYWPAGRPARTSALHAELASRNAVFGVSYGMEVPLYFAPEGAPATERPSLGRSDAFAQVACECKAARTTAGIIDISSFAKYRMTGPDAVKAVARLSAGRLPPPGRVRLAPLLAASGRLMGDLTLLRLSESEYWLTGSGYLQSWHMRWFSEQLIGLDVRVENLSDSHGGFAVFGPRSRAWLQSIAEDELSDAQLPFMSVRCTQMGFAPVVLARLSVTGELGFELYTPTNYLPALFARLRSSGEAVGARDTGLYALNSLRLEKGFGIWSREFSRDYTPRSAGLDRFIDYERMGFVGREAALRDRDTAPARRLVLLAIEAADADATGYEPITRGDQLVGFVTSGGYGHCAGQSLAMGYLDGHIDVASEDLRVSVLGEPRPCRVLARPPIDPDGKRMRS